MHNAIVHINTTEKKEAILKPNSYTDWTIPNTHINRLLYTIISTFNYGIAATECRIEKKKNVNTLGHNVDCIPT